MLARRRIRGRVISWVMGLTALGVAYVTFIDCHPGQEKKVEANRIMSPWDLSSAPPPYVDRSEVKVKPLPANAQKKGAGPAKQETKRSDQTSRAAGRRIVDARTGTQPQHTR